jgi:hypothetical protein
MAKRPTAEMIAEGLTVPERVLLFCVASDTDWRRAGVKATTAQRMLIRGLIQPAKSPRKARHNVTGFFWK